MKKMKEVIWNNRLTMDTPARQAPQSGKVYMQVHWEVKRQLLQHIAEEMVSFPAPN